MRSLVFFDVDISNNNDIASHGDGCVAQVTHIRLILPSYAILLLADLREIKTRAQLPNLMGGSEPSVAHVDQTGSFHRQLVGQSIHQPYYASRSLACLALTRPVLWPVPPIREEHSHHVANGYQRSTDQVLKLAESSGVSSPSRVLDVWCGIARGCRQ